MGKLKQFLRLSINDQVHLGVAAALLLLFAVVIRLRPFPSVVRSQTPPGRLRQCADPAVRKRIAWAVRKAAHYLPAATCLPQALAARALLRWHGEPAILRVGVAKTDQGELQAHAWVESRGEVVVGDFCALGRYTAFPDLDT